MKRITLILSLVFTLAITVFIGACSSGGSDNPGNGGGTGGTQPTAPLTFTGITFSNKTVTYDGREYALTVNGTVPEGTQVSYTNKKGTNAGVYNATATLTKEGYTTLNLSAKLTINKAVFTGITFTDETYVATGTTHTLTIKGDLPENTKVSYTNNSASAAGVYNATATVTNPNYTTLTLNATLTIKSLTTAAKDIVDSLMDKPDPWSFLPEAFSHENMAYSAMPVNDFTSFVNVSAIGYKIIGKQFNVLYEGLTDTATLLGYLDNVYAVGGTIANLYQTYINQNPDDYKQFSGEAGGFKFKIILNGDKSELLAGNSTVSIELTYDGTTKARTGRIQLTDGMALKYRSSENSLKLAVKTTIAGVGTLKQIQFERNNGAVAGYLYEYTGTENNNLKTSAVIASNSVKTVITSNKREADDLKINYYEEVYNSQTGKFIGGEVNEKVSESSSKTYDTLWLMLNDINGLTSVKAEHKQNIMNDDTIYINGSSDSMHTKTVSLLDLSRRFDIEMKDVWYVVENNGKYETVKTSIPMLFVQIEHTSTFSADFKDKNNITATLPSFTAVTQDYELMGNFFNDIKENVSYADIVAYIGTQNSFFN